MVMEAADGHQALECVNACQPNLIGVDLQMPGMNGFSVMAELRGNCRFLLTPVIALTARAMAGDQERAIGAGSNSCITKPISILALRQKMLEFLENPSAANHPACGGP